MKRGIFIFIFFPLYAFGQRVVVANTISNTLSLMNVSSPFEQRNNVSPHGSALNQVLYNSGYLYTISSGNDRIYILRDDNIPFVIDSIFTGASSNPYMASISGNKIFVSLLLYDSIVSYDLSTKNEIWSVGVWRSPQYVGMKGGYLFAISTGYDMNSYTTDTSTIYKIDTSTGIVLDSLRLGINMLYMEFMDGDTAIVSGGDWFDASTQKIYIIRTDSLRVIDSISTPANIGFLRRIPSTDTVIAVGYSWIGYFIYSSRIFVPLPLVTYYGFSQVEIFNDRLFITAVMDYTTNGNIIVYNRTTNSIEHVATVDIGPISITLSPTTLSTSERKIITKNKLRGIYSLDGRKVNSIRSKGVYFIVEDGKVRRLIVR